MTRSVDCECGKPATGEHEVWNGMHYLPVCTECWHNPETIVMEAAVSYESGDHQTLEEALRIELGFRETEWTRELQALCDKRYIEWYVPEPASG